MIYSQLLTQVQGIDHSFGTKDSSVQISPRPWLAKQVHSDHFIELVSDDGLPPSETIEADAIITNCRSQRIGVQTADCLPILMVAPDISYIAAVHAGWRGTAANIIYRVIEELVGKGARRGGIRVAMGPCISVNHYEVGEDVAKMFALFVKEKNNGKYQLDLIAAGRRSLLDAGVLPINIDIVSLCTFEREDLFYSYRRDGEGTGRQISWIEIAS